MYSLFASNHLGAGRLLWEAGIPRHRGPAPSGQVPRPQDEPDRACRAFARLAVRTRQPVQIHVPAPNPTRLPRAAQAMRGPLVQCGVELTA